MNRKASFDHVGIAVKDLDQTLGFYKAALGLEPERTETYGEIKTKISYIPIGDFQIHLLTPLEPGAGAVGEFVEKKGGGLHHIGVRVDNLDETVEKLKKLNVPIRDNKVVTVKPGLRVAMTNPASTQNVAIELIERKD